MKLVLDNEIAVCSYVNSLLNISVKSECLGFTVCSTKL